MMIIGIWSSSKDPCCWWWGFYQRPSILDDNDWDLIHVKAFLMMTVVIWSMSQNQIFVKTTKIWLWWQLKLVPWPIFSKNYQNLVAMTLKIGHMTNFWQNLSKFGGNDNWKWSSNQFLVKITQLGHGYNWYWPLTNFWLKLPKFNRDDHWNWSYDQFLIKITKFWSRLQLKLVTWPIFCHNNQKIFGNFYRNLVTWPIFGKIYQKYKTT